MTRILITIGLLMIVIGLAWPLFSKFGIGHLPGDILIKRKNFTFYFPITSCILISLIVTLILWIINKFL